MFVLLVTGSYWYIPCSSASWVAAFGAIPQDTYRITVMGVEGRCTLPNEPSVTQEAYAHQANVTTAVGQVVRTAQVGGRVYLDNLIPTSGPATCSGATPRAALTFTGALSGATYAFSVPCSSTTYTMPSQTVLQDTYRVTVAGLLTGTTPLSALPAHPFVAHTALSVTSDSPSLRFDVQTRSWEGPITLNGVLPTTSCTSPTEKAEVRLTGALHGQVETDAVRCGEVYRQARHPAPTTSPSATRHRATVKRSRAAALAATTPTVLMAWTRNVPAAPGAPATARLTPCNSPSPPSC
jgi:hypothetical protein